MGIFKRFRSVLSAQDTCPPEHLEGYRRIGEEVYGAKVELADDTNDTVRVLLRVAETFQVMGNALLNDVLTKKDAPFPEITHEQAETWYGHIPDLLIAARKESLYPGSSNVTLPIQIGKRIESEQMCPLSHLAGLRRASANLEQMVASPISMLRRNKESHRETLLLYEEARTRRATGDALVGSIMNGEYVPHEIHEDAKEQYWQALSKYLLVVQGIEDNQLISNWLFPKSNLDSDDPWRITAKLALADLQESGEFEETQEKLESFWSHHEITDKERQYESTVKRLLTQGAITENGYWYRLPFQPVYQVVVNSVDVHHRTVTRGQEFVWDYPYNGRGDGLVTRSSFRYTDNRSQN